MIVRVQRLFEDAILPEYRSDGAVGLDLYTVRVEVLSGGLIRVGTGVALCPAAGDWIMLAARSSIYKHGYMLANNVGVIDPDYTGEIIAMLIPLRPAGRTITQPHTLPRIGESVLQAVVMVQSTATIVEVSTLATTARGAGGFGSTGA